MENHAPDIPATMEPAAELDQLGDEIAELSAHLEAATARLLDLIRAFARRSHRPARLSTPCATRRRRVGTARPPSTSPCWRRRPRTRSASPTSRATATWTRSSSGAARMSRTGATSWVPPTEGRRARSASISWRGDADGGGHPGVRLRRSLVRGSTWRTVTRVRIPLEPRPRTTAAHGVGSVRHETRLRGNRSWVRRGPAAGAPAARRSARAYKTCPRITSSFNRGSRTVNRAPFPTPGLSAFTVPSCSSTR
jgi:hypothetical protein